MDWPEGHRLQLSKWIDTCSRCPQTREWYTGQGQTLEQGKNGIGDKMRDKAMNSLKRSKARGQQASAAKSGGCRLKYWLLDQNFGFGVLWRMSFKTHGIDLTWTLRIQLRM
jgi:hypothetical protein